MKMLKATLVSKTIFHGKTTGISCDGRVVACSTRVGRGMWLRTPLLPVFKVKMVVMAEDTQKVELYGRSQFVTTAVDIVLIWAWSFQSR
jgi:hypothetical protein